jgi:glucose/mannose-6-phosphate isomerase
MPAIDLDDRAAIARTDAAGMLGTIGDLGAHAAAGYAAGRSVTGLPSIEGVTSIVFCGMGGSAVAGDVLKQTFRDRLIAPVDVNRSPILPAYAGPHTLVIVSSFSGETSETLAAAREAVARGCRVLAITSGGSLGELCADRGIAVAPVPAGFQPRAALGHLTFAMLGALETAGLVPALGADVAETTETLASSAAALGPDVPVASNPAKELAVWLGDRVPVIWGAEGIGAVAAMRWKTQMNENGKVPAWHAAMSELDHNEVVGWTAPYGERHAIIALRSTHEHPELAARFALSADIARAAGAEVREVEAPALGPLASLLALIHVGDFASCYVGLGRGVDPTPVDVITKLKAALAAMDLG